MKHASTVVTHHRNYCTLYRTNRTNRTYPSSRTAVGGVYEVNTSNNNSTRTGTSYKNSNIVPYDINTMTLRRDTVFLGHISHHFLLFPPVRKTKLPLHILRSIFLIYLRLLGFFLILYQCSVIYFFAFFLWKSFSFSCFFVFSYIQIYIYFKCMHAKEKKHKSPRPPTKQKLCSSAKRVHCKKQRE